MKASYQSYLALLMILMLSLWLSFAACGDDDDDDDDDDTGEEDDDDAVDDDDSGDDDDCGGEDLCEPMIEAGFHFEGGEEDCLDWFANNGYDDCDDYDAFLACACDCLPAVNIGDFEACIGQCINEAGCFGA